MTCEHSIFKTEVTVYRLSEETGGPITGYTADIRIKCNDCGVFFRFLGVPAGSHPAEPRVSADALELHAPLEPGYTTEILGIPPVVGRA
jgi:hypothetical protein